MPEFSNPKIAKLYQDVPAESLRYLLSFRERYPYEAVTLNGIKWYYIDTREGETALFIPAGGTSIAEVSFKSIEHFAQRYRVISPDYPPIESLKELFKGFIALLDHLGINKFNAMGGSYGGWMVQSLVRQYPEKIRKLVITAVGPPDSENSREINRLMVWFRITPTFMLRSMINRTFTRLESESSGDKELTMLWALVKEAVYYRVGRADILAALQRLVNQTQNYTFSADDLKDWPGSMLVVFGSDDPATPAERREAMRALYPQAEVKVIEGAMHGMAITHKEEYFAAIDEFLAR
jgi:pimeloyl-ACP methyl ester carboxylesterase